MHRGSSKGDRAAGPAAGILPLSASPRPPSVSVTLELTRGASVRRRRVRIPRGAPIRAALRAADLPAEGCAVMLDETPVPLDLPLDRPVRLVVVSTFSGG